VASSAVEAGRITDAMFLAAAKTIAEASPAKLDPHANLLPPLTKLQELSFAVAVATARQAQAEGLALASSIDEVEAAVARKMWNPVYANYRRKL